MYVIRLCDLQGDFDTDLWESILKNEFVSTLLLKFSFHLSNDQIHVTTNGSFSMIIYILAVGYYPCQNIQVSTRSLMNEEN